MLGSRRGTSSLSAESGEEGVWGSGWVWDGERVVRLRVHNDSTIPTSVMACGDVWKVRYEGAPTVCFKCGDPQHLAPDCKAARREESVASRWDPDMGLMIEVFFFNQKVGYYVEQ